MWRMGVLLLVLGLVCFFAFHRRRSGHRKPPRDVNTPYMAAPPVPPPLLLDTPVDTSREIPPPEASEGAARDTLASARTQAHLQNALHILLAACPQASRAVVFLYDPRGAHLHLWNARGRTHDIGVCKTDQIRLGDGILGWVARERRAVSIADLNRQPGKLAYDDGSAPIASFLAVPIMEGDLYEGLLCMDSATVAAFSEADEQKAQLLAREILMILQFDRQRRQMRQATRIDAVLLSISQNLASRMDLSHRLSSTVALAREVVAYDVCFVFLIEPDGRRARVKIALGARADVVNHVFALTDGLLSLIVRTRQGILFSNPDAVGEPDHRIFPSRCRIETKARSFLGLPMITEDRVLAIALFGSNRENSYTDHDRRVLSIVCNHAATAIAEANMHARLEQMAATDGLTGLFNHRAFQDKMAEEFVRSSRHPEPFSLLLIDVDHFKKVNDTYGHPAGDAVLKAIAGILTRQIRKADWVARYGGEEFAVLLVRADSGQALQMAERIRKAVDEAPMRAQNQTLHVTISIGIASYPEDATLREEMIARTDQALYAAKRDGRNRALCYPAIKKDVRVA